MKVFLIESVLKHLLETHFKDRSHRLKYAISEESIGDLIDQLENHVQNMRAYVKSAAINVTPHMDRTKSFAIIRGNVITTTFPIDVVGMSEEEIKDKLRVDVIYDSIGEFMTYNF